MKAVQISEYGDPSVAKVVEIEKPTLKPGQVLVEVHASSLNPFDSAIRFGYMQESIPLQLPVTLGGDIAGVVAEVSKDVTDFVVGDKVYGQANVVAGNSGAFAEFSATSAGQIAKAPKGLSSNEAASLPLVGVSALQGIVDHINLQSGQKIFITGGNGGIGRVAIQLAKHLGAYVATTATGEGMNVAKELGSDVVIDYKSQDFTQVLSDYDAVFDTVGGDDFVKTFGVLKNGGTAVTMIAEVNMQKATELGINASMQMTKVSTNSLNKLREYIESGIISPHVGKVFDVDNIAEAFTARESGSVPGKIVIEIKSGK